MTATRQVGMFLLEALVAIVVLSFGLLGLLGLVANALHASGGVAWRQQAFDVGASALSQMWTENPSVLASRYDAATNGPGYRALLAAAMRLPGVDARTNAPVVTFDDAAIDGTHVSVTLFWRVPMRPDIHRSTVTGVLPRH